MDTALQRKEEVRHQLLQHFYRVTDGISARLVTVDGELAARLGLEPSEMDSAVEFLVGEGSLKQIALGSSYSITHQGVVEVEQSLREPATAAVHPVVRELRQKATSLPPEKRTEAESVIDQIEEMLETGPKALVNTNKLIESLVTYWPEAMPWLASLAQQAGRFLAG